MFYDRGNRPGFHIFIISARSRNVKYILTENVPVKRFALSPGLFVIRAYAARLHPKGTSSRFALRAPRRPAASSQWQTWELHATECVPQRLPACMALRERRYRRNWFLRFYRKPARIV